MNRWLAAALVGAFSMTTAVPAYAGDGDVGTAGELRKLFDGLEFTEGPTADREGSLYFTDIRANRIYRVDAKGELAAFFDDSKGSNGLMVDGGRLLVCQKDEGRVIAVDLETKAVTVIADKFGGSRFIGPNDLVVDKKGGVYFTDPRFPSSAPGHQDKQGVYYAAPDGTVTRLIDDLERPNGVLLSPDEKTLYVLPSGTADVMTYPVIAAGRIGPGRSLSTLDQAPGVPVRGGDGLTVAKDGTLYVAQPDLEALQVLTPAGKTLGFIKLPGRPTNVEFGGRDLKTLYITLHHRNAEGKSVNGSLYAIAMKKKGHRFGKK
jgi:gluconolactonase